MHIRDPMWRKIRGALQSADTRRILPLMDTFSDIIMRWPSLREFADDLGVPYVTAQVMKHRDSIAAEHWSAVVAGARARKIKGVSFELLARLKAEKAGRRPLAGKAATMARPAA